MLADYLTKDDPKAGDYLRYVVKTGYLKLTAIPYIDEVLGKENLKAKSGHQAYYDAKYPGKQNKKEISMDMFGKEGWSTSRGCSVFTKYKPKKFVVAPGPGTCWRLTLGDGGLG